MPHRADSRDAQVLVADVVDVGLFRVHPLASGGVAVLGPADATRDGAPIIGRLAVVAWGDGAILRAASERVAIVWDARAGRVVPRSGQACNLCHGGFDVGKDQAAIACACGMVFHLECHELVITCAECGAPRGDVAR
jgi:hypothetical protein